MVDGQKHGFLDMADIYDIADGCACAYRRAHIVSRRLCLGNVLELHEHLRAEIHLWCELAG